MQLTWKFIKDSFALFILLPFFVVPLVYFAPYGIVLFYFFKYSLFDNDYVYYDEVKTILNSCIEGNVINHRYEKWLRKSENDLKECHLGGGWSINNSSFYSVVDVAISPFDRALFQMGGGKYKMVTILYDKNKKIIGYITSD